MLHAYEPKNEKEISLPEKTPRKQNKNNTSYIDYYILNKFTVVWLVSLSDSLAHELTFLNLKLTKKGRHSLH